MFIITVEHDDWYHELSRSQGNPERWLKNSHVLYELERVWLDKVIPDDTGKLIDYVVIIVIAKRATEVVK